MSLAVIQITFQLSSVVSYSQRPILIVFVEVLDAIIFFLLLNLL